MCIRDRSFIFYSDEVLTDVKVSTFGEPIRVGDIMFDIQYVANFDYLEKTKEFKIAEKAEIDRGLIEASNEKPEYTYFQIQVTAENKGSEIVRLTGGQLHLYDDSNKRYTPSTVTIAAGGTVTFSNTDTAPHTSTSGSAADGPDGVFDTSLIMANASYSVTLSDAGTYTYFCMVHPWMEGTIIVE